MPKPLNLNIFHEVLNRVKDKNENFVMEPKIFREKEARK